MSHLARFKNRVLLSLDYAILFFDKKNKWGMSVHFDFNIQWLNNFLRYRTFFQTSFFRGELGGPKEINTWTPKIQVSTYYEISWLIQSRETYSWFNSTYIPQKYF